MGNQNISNAKSFTTVYAAVVFFSISMLMSLLVSANQISIQANNLEIHPDVSTLVSANIEPEGVVFDVETLEANALNELADYIKLQVETVKRAYPDVDVAVVSHGVEEYALQTSQQQKNDNLHNVFSQLVSTKDISVHVCGAVAGLKKLSQEDFPEYVSYSESGMAQINDYKALGYKVIVIKQLNDKQRKALFANPENYFK